MNIAYPINIKLVILFEYDLADWLEKDLEAGIKIYRNTILQNKENDN